MSASERDRQLNGGGGYIPYSDQAVIVSRGVSDPNVYAPVTKPLDQQH
jgi:hypothetical protein